MAGTALIHVIDRWPMRSQKARAVEPVVEDQAGAGHQRRQQSDHLGVDVEERQRVEAAVIRLELEVRRHTTRRVESSLLLAQPDDLGRPGRARRRQDDAAGDGALDGAVAPGRVTGPSLEVIEAVQFDPVRRQSGRGGAVGHHHLGAGARHGGRQARRCRPDGIGGSSGATQKPAAMAPRKASANATGSLMARPTVVSPRARTPPSWARQRSMLPSSWRKDRTLPSRACST